MNHFNAYSLFIFKQHPSNVNTTVKEILILLQHITSCEVEQFTSLLEYRHEEHAQPMKKKILLITKIINL